MPRCGDCATLPGPRGRRSWRPGVGPDRRASPDPSLRYGLPAPWTARRGNRRLTGCRRRRPGPRSISLPATKSGHSCRGGPRWVGGDGHGTGGRRSGVPRRRCARPQREKPVRPWRPTGTLCAGKSRHRGQTDPRARRRERHEPANARSDPRMHVKGRTGNMPTSRGTVRTRRARPRGLEVHGGPFPRRFRVPARRRGPARQTGRNPLAGRQVRSLSGRLPADAGPRRHGRCHPGRGGCPVCSRLIETIRLLSLAIHAVGAVLLALPVRRGVAVSTRDDDEWIRRTR